jgi:dipeptidyl aminopeptidase/acylaminoacyl peptidase
VIPGYLTLPKGAEVKNLPTIILPHGGPFARDSWGYDYWSQFLAAQGYAVLQMNYRGSSDYNYDFSDKGKGEYAGKMITDINDGAKWMIEKGYTDPKRVCIVGWSYGGYAALKAPLVDKDLYKCSVAGAAVADVGRQKRESNARAYYRRYIDSSEASYAEMSPINYVEDYNIPLLVVHGKRDHQVNYAHSVDMVDALKSAGKDVRFVTLENETHYLDKEKSRIIFLSEMEKFLAKHLK